MLFNVKMNVLGIDSSLTGFALSGKCIDGSILETEWKSVSKGDRVKDRFYRYVWIINKLYEVLDSKRGYWSIFMEGYSLASKGRSVITLGEFGGVLRKAILDHEKVTILEEVPPKTLKKFMTGNGNASKTLMATVLAKDFNRSFSSDNVSDAFAVFQLGMMVLGYSEVRTKYQRGIVDSIASNILKESQNVETR